jgi:hypothetical protein
MSDIPMGVPAEKCVVLVLDDDGPKEEEASADDCRDDVPDEELCDFPRKCGCRNLISINHLTDVHDWFHDAPPDQQIEAGNDPDDT